MPKQAILPHFPQVNNAVGTDVTHEQWIDLGVHTEACLTRPDTSGTAGCAISMWVRVTSCTGANYIITSRSFRNSSGFTFSCLGNTFEDVTTEHMG